MYLFQYNVSDKDFSKKCAESLPWFQNFGQAKNIIKKKNSNSSQNLDKIVEFPRKYLSDQNLYHNL